ncbi:MAG: Gx transporter family protein [Oscillospiraceae bacterium]|nr:Gx transporter family protein [Oscillospiraceae bacterium]
MKTKKLTAMAVLAAVSVTIFVAESQLPPIVPVPGVKLGLANIITLTAASLLGRREAGLILTVRIILGNIFSGGVSAMIFSLSGGVFAYAAMCLTIKRFPVSLIWVVSIFSAVMHNFGQIAAAAALTRTAALFAYLPVLAVSGIVTGAFTGTAAVYLIKAMEKRRNKDGFDG